MEAANGPSRGKKQCPQCKVYIGVRNFKCPQCNHEFAAKVHVEEAPKVQEATPVQQEDDGSSTKNLIQIIAPGTGWPAKEPLCPFDLPEPNKESVFRWIEDCQGSVIHKHMEYSEDALIYMIKFAGKIPNNNLKEIRPLIQQYFQACA